jgi:hypothetical protein
MIYQRIIGTVFKLDTEEKLVSIDGDDYNYASDAESTLMEAIENDFMVSALLYSEHFEGSTRLLRAQILYDEHDDDDKATNPLLDEA